MSSSLNFGMREGNLTRDPELQQTKNGKSVIRFTIAVNRSYKGSDGKYVNEPAFIPCEAWDTGAEAISKYFKKGDPIRIEEELKQENWVAESGEKRSRLVARVTRFHFVNGYDYKNHCWPGKTSRSSNSGTDNGPPTDEPQGSAPGSPDSDIPF